MAGIGVAGGTPVATGGIGAIGAGTPRAYPPQPWHESAGPVNDTAGAGGAKPPNPAGGRLYTPGGIPPTQECDAPKQAYARPVQLPYPPDTRPAQLP
jgi:hypothetical protein